MMKRGMMIQIIAEVDTSEIKYGFEVDGEPMTMDELDAADRRVSISVLGAFINALKDIDDGAEGKGMA